MDYHSYTHTHTLTHTFTHTLTHTRARIKLECQECRSGWGPGLHTPQDFSIRATIHVLELNCNFELGCYRVFMPKIHKHMYQLIPPTWIGHFLRDMPLFDTHPAPISWGTQLCQGTYLIEHSHLTLPTNTSVSHVQVSFCKVGCHFSEKTWELKLYLNPTQNRSLITNIGVWSVWAKVIVGNSTTNQFV